MEEKGRKAAPAPGSKAWERYGEDPRREAAVEGLMDFVTRCKTERETVRHLEGRLREEGFGPLEAPGPKGVFLNWKDRALAAYRSGRKPLGAGVRLVAAHADSPRIDLKPRPLYEDGGLLMGDGHYYGGLKKYQWVNLPLALHGEVHRTDGTTVRLALGEDPSDPVLLVPDLAPHLDREQENRKASETVTGENLDALLGHRPRTGEEKDPVKAAVLALLEERYGFGEEDLTSSDLALVPAGPARRVGVDGALVGAYGLDDRVCVFCGFEAFLEARDLPRGAVFLALDREEIGSEGVGGAQGALLELFLGELLGREGCGSVLDLRRCLAASEALSADVTEGGNPLYKESFDPRQTPRPGDGPAMMKVTGQRGKYDASEARGEFVARVRRALEGENVPWQTGSLGRVDKGGGGTVAKYLSRSGMDVLDLGPALLSMHAPYELVSTADVLASREAYRAFYEGD
ncbi:aminopeptidase 1 [Aminomonas paucivorans]|uniref:aminopeptidase 1 n=1 Tax=Aminomonas paucivorans TaxID=81412 RepID=UPI003325CD3A